MSAADSEVELTPEQIRAQQAEGYQEAETSTTKEDSTPVADPGQTAEEIAEEAAKEVVPGYTADKLKEALSKAGQYDSLRASLDKVNGKFGSLEQTIKNLQEAKAMGSVVEMTEDDVADLKQEYGPELASALLKSLNKFVTKIGGAKAVPEKDTADSRADEFDQKMDQKIAKTTQSLEMKILNVTHPDWRSVVRVRDESGNETGFNPEFVKWTSSLPAEDQDKIYNSWDADFLSAKVGEFKGYLKAVAEKTETKGKAKTVPKRLETNVEVRGVPGSAPSKTALDEQREGYNSD